MNDITNSKNLLFEKEMKQSYLDYAMTVITNRAIPNAADGLKPVQRRILYAMIDGGYTWDKPYKKSAHIVGDVLGKYHPHGDSAVYDAMVRMAQPFSMNIPLIDGQGNFGSIDGDKAASMRYTEARLAKISQYLLKDYDKNTVNMEENYDNSLLIPSVLPVQIPNLLVNGASGIAVGMATFVPPHNLGEIIDATCALLDNSNLSTEELMEYVPGPDFPSGCTIFASSGLRKMYETGRGSFVVRGEIKQEKADLLVITEIPHAVNKIKLIEQIVDLVANQDLEDIDTVRDESTYSGIRIVLELKKRAMPDVIIHKLYNLTSLQTSVHTNMLALHKGQPKVLTLKDALHIFIEFRDNVLVRRTLFYLKQDKQKAHILWGLSLALSKLDEVIHIIKSSQTVAEARERLMKIVWPWNQVLPYLQCIHENISNESEYSFSDVQVKAILDLKLQALTGLEREKLWNSLQELGKNIKYYKELLEDQNMRFALIREEMQCIRTHFSRKRLSKIDYSSYDNVEEDFIKQEDMVVTISHSGYVKRLPLDTYRVQKRGGRGKQGSLNSPISHLFVANTHQEVLFFSMLGKAYSTKVYKLPVATTQSMGRALVNFFPFTKSERIAAVLAIPLLKNEEYTLIFITSKGYVRRNDISDFENLRANGKIAIKLDDDESLIGALLAEPSDEILLTSSNGKSVRFEISTLRIFHSRSSRGVKGMVLDENAYVVSATLLNRTNVASYILTVTENGYGKRAKIDDYRKSNRSTRGVLTTLVTKLTGPVIGAFNVSEDDDLMIMNSQGQVIRLSMSEVRIANRRTQGVKLVKMNQDVLVSHVFVISETEIESEKDE